MTQNLHAKFAQCYERHRLLFVLFIFLVGLGAGTQALEYYFPRQQFSWMNLMHNGVGLAELSGLILMMLSAIQLLSLKATRRGYQVLFDSFVERSNMLALAASWAFTLVMAMGTSEWTEPDVFLYGARESGSLFEPRFYFQLLICCMTISYSVGFFFFNFVDKASQEGAGE